MSKVSEALELFRTCQTDDKSLEIMIDAIPEMATLLLRCKPWIEWLKVYLGQYLEYCSSDLNIVELSSILAEMGEGKHLPCADAKRCPQANDVTCQECEKGGGEMTVAQIVKDYLENHGYDGLFCEMPFEGNCGCSKDDLFPCGRIFELCQPAYKHKDRNFYLEKEAPDGKDRD